MVNGMTLLEAIDAVLRRAEGPLHVQDLYAELPDRLRHSIRSQIYRNLGGRFQRVGRGLYVAIEGEAACVVVEGDALEELRKIPSGTADAVITDPPYEDPAHEIGTRKKIHLDYERREIDLTLAIELNRVLKPGAHAFIFVPAETGTTRPGIERLISTLERAGFQFNKRWIWHKRRMGMGYNGRSVHEGILFMSKGRRRMPCDLSVKDVIDVPPVYPSRKRHPSEKPVGLLQKLVEFATRVGETVIDCFAGSLSTGRAALSLGRNALLIEKDPSLLAKALGEVVA